MIDFHSHLLPGIDDGSDSTETSLAMLDLWRSQGIRRICCTPHFYAYSNTPARFLVNRKNAYEKLQIAMRQADSSPDVWPKLLLGAEVHFFDGMSSSEDLPSLCLHGTNLLLVEMPFRKWTDRMLEEIVQINHRGLQPVAAHIERYFDFNSGRMIRRFMEDTGVMIQCNASFFLNQRTRRHALKMLKKEQIHFLGSDAHNMEGRKPNLGPALELIEDKLGGASLEWLEDIEVDWIDISP